MTEPAIPPERQAHAGEQSTPPRTIDAEQLFQGSREIWIEHQGVRYRLRLTRRNKLILQK
jgi:hemin uptake protein HemP